MFQIAISFSIKYEIFVGHLDIYFKFFAYCQNRSASTKIFIALVPILFTFSNKVQNIQRIFLFFIVSFPINFQDIIVFVGYVLYICILCKIYIYIYIY